ncbi:MAG: radical SAM protein, partial [Spirochaetales bacterium]|nr:radical SAM protein [Spirochaetales bacterium]
MKIILVSIHVEKSPAAFPLAACILKETLKNNTQTSAADISISEYFLPLDDKKIAEELIDRQPDIIGFSTYLWNADTIIKISNEIKSKNKAIKLIIGGPQATAAPESFEQTKLFDTIMIGEGEPLIADAVLGKINGISERKQHTDFEISASPYSTILKKDRTEGILWEISRGCPYRCAFCYESRGFKTIRTINSKRIETELKLFRKNKIKKIWVLDPTFNHNGRHAEEVLTKIINIYPEAHYTFEIRAELMNKKLCSMFSEINCSLQIGLQSTNIRALKNINRSLNEDKFINRCKTMSEYGLCFGIDLIYGLPGDNYETFKSSVDFALSTAPNNVDIFPLSVLPATDLFENAVNLEIIHNGFPKYTTIKTKTFSESDMKKAEKLTEAVDILYNQEQSFSWFNTFSKILETSPSLIFESFNRFNK